MVKKNSTQPPQNGMGRDKRGELKRLKKATLALAKVKTVLGRTPQRRSGAEPGLFGPVATIDTAPVSIGNTVQGAKPVVTQVEGGCRVRGRDYFLSVPGIASIDTNWQFVAGAPLAPACMVASAVRSFANAYSQYVIHRMSFHFITAESTANSGNIVLYVAKDRAGPGLNTLSSNFLPVVLSDEHSVIGPLWTNNTAHFNPVPEWRPTDVFNVEDLRHQAVGELMVFTKSAVLQAPGYVLVDYDMSFREMSVNIKTLSLPVSRMKYTQVSLVNTASHTAGDTVAVFMNLGVLLDAVTVSTPPAGTVPGDVYKIVMSLANNGLGGLATNAVFSLNALDGKPAITLNEGFTCYGVVDNAGTALYLFDTFAGATGKGAFSQLCYATTGTYNLQIQCQISLVASSNPALTQVSF
nr:MAG: coat protein [Leptochloa chinensis tombus-like virus 1]